jgi:hypothetical protein
MHRLGANHHFDHHLVGSLVRGNAIRRRGPRHAVRWEQTRIARSRRFNTMPTVLTRPNLEAIAIRLTKTELRPGTSALLLQCPTPHGGATGLGDNSSVVSQKTIVRPPPM